MVVGDGRTWGTSRRSGSHESLHGISEGIGGKHGRFSSYSVQENSEVENSLSQSMEDVLEFTEADMPRERSQPEVVTAKVREMFYGKTLVKITDVAHALK